MDKTNLMVYVIVLFLTTYLSLSYTVAQQLDGEYKIEYSIRGFVKDETPDISEKNLIHIESMKTITELEMLEEPFQHYVVEGLLTSTSTTTTVILYGVSNSIVQQMVTEIDGKFLFEHLPIGDYTIVAEAFPRFPVRHISERKATGSAHVHLTNHISNLYIPISAYAVSLQGRVLAEDGTPIANAIVKGIPRIYLDESTTVPYRYKYELTKESKTNLRGEYELKGFIPENIYSYAILLAGGEWRTSVKVSVYADDYIQEMIPIIPLISKELLPAAQRIVLVLLPLRHLFGEKDQFAYTERTDLPKSENNVILAEDIILKRTDEPDAAKVP